MSLGFYAALAALAVIFAVVLTIGLNQTPRVLRILLRIDIQNDFCEGGNLAVPGGSLIVAIVNKLSQLGKQFRFYDLVIDSQDSHPENHGSFFTQHPGLQAFTMSVLSGIQQMLWTVHCVIGTKGWEFHPDLDRSMVDLTVPKGQDARVDSYSAFYDNGLDAAAELKKQYPFLGQSTGLADYIVKAAQRERAEEICIDVVGLAFDYCVAFSAKDARRIVYRGKNIRVRVIIDATKAIANKPEEIAAKVAELKAAGIEVVTSDDVLAEIEPNPALSPYAARWW